MSDDLENEAAQIFLLEAAELLESIEATALEISREPESAGPDAINRLFRAFHTIKGSGSMCGFEPMARFTHHVESILDAVREGALVMSSRLVELLLVAKDHILELLEYQPENPDDVLPKTREIIAGLDALRGKSAPAAETPTSPPPHPAAPAPATPVAPTAPTQPARSYQVTLALPQGDAKKFPLETILAELNALGSSRLIEEPAPESAPPARWVFAVTTAQPEDTIRDAFIFFAGSSELTVAPQLDASVSPKPAQKSKPADKPVAAPSPAKAPSRDEKSSSSRKPATESTVRVSSEKLDSLVNLVGEMVINQSRLSQVAAQSGQPDLMAPVEALERLVDEMRDSVLGIRMMPIGSTFNRFKRLVHDLSRELGKDIQLVTEGEETELDKTVLDQLGDPLVHLIRNSLDHGIESPDQRAAAGKPRQGTIRLVAAHEGSQVVIRIEDDGKGLDRDRIRAKAIERKLISAEAVLSDKEIFGLIFQPGFSTAQQVTSVSGRGVGMDVVKRQLDALRGGIHIASTPGIGTTIALTLPLTLAIIDGLLVEVGGDQFIVPMTAVTENVELHEDDRRRNNGRNVVTVRGELISYIRLRELFEIRDAAPAIEKIVIVHHEGHRVGLVVDRVLGSHQTVIQGLGRMYQDISVVSGATIMGDGRVALIFDLPGLVAASEAPVSPHPVTFPVPS